MLNLEYLSFNISSTNNYYKCIGLLNNEEVCKCQINIHNSIWTISSWYTNDKYLHMGIGTATLKYLIKYLKQIKSLEQIEYIWNGTNEYVYKWMKTHFDATCKCPLAVQKTQSEDDWESHIYCLDLQKFLSFFNI